MKLRVSEFFITKSRTLLLGTGQCPLKRDGFCLSRDSQHNGGITQQCRYFSVVMGNIITCTYEPPAPREQGLCDPRCTYQEEPGPERVPSTRTVVLASCTSKKEDRMMRAEYLYKGTWFKLASAWARRNGDEWMILSAKYGLVKPHHWLAPYDQVLPRHRAKREEWAADVADLVEQWVHHPPAYTRIVILAGKLYREPLADLLRAKGYTVEEPLRGMGIGLQQQWLSRHNYVADRRAELAAKIEAREEAED